MQPCSQWTGLQQYTSLQHALFIFPILCIVLTFHHFRLWQKDGRDFHYILLPSFLIAEILSPFFFYCFSKLWWEPISDNSGWRVESKSFCNMLDLKIYICCPRLYFNTYICQNPTAHSGLVYRHMKLHTGILFIIINFFLHEPWTSVFSEVGSNFFLNRYVSDS